MALTKTQLSAISRLFSPGVLNELARKGRSPLFARLYTEAGLLDQRKVGDKTVGAAYETAFSMLRKTGLRDEYVYKAALTHNILLGCHSLNTASMLTEFRAGNCKADLVILNGTGTVYEIKSDRDSLARLSNQIHNYQKVFAKVYVIAGQAHVQEVMESTSEDVGVLSLVRWNRIQTVRKATDRMDLICPATIFDSLRVQEARLVLNNLHVTVPDVPNMLLRSEMRKLFQGLDPEEIHQEMVSVLKKSRSLDSLSSLVDNLPKSLQPAALSIQVRHADHERFVSAIHTPLPEALTWAY